MLPKDILDKLKLSSRGEAFGGELFLGLVVSERKVKTAIWSLTAEGGKIASFGSVEQWNGESAEELIVAADASIATAVARLPQVPQKPPSKVLLGLPEHWVEGSAIIRSKLNILQEVCKKLEFKPAGFVVVQEAIAHLLKQEEGGQPGIILVHLEETEIIVSLVAQGKFLGSKVVGRSDSLALDVEEGLLRFDYQEVFPNRILLINGEKSLEEAKQSLIVYPWLDPGEGKKLNFLQLPKIEVAEPDFETAAVVEAGSHDMVGSKTIPDSSGPKVVSPQENQAEESVAFGEGVKERELAEVTESGSSSPESELVPPSDSFNELVLADFGFVEGEDIQEISPDPGIDSAGGNFGESVKEKQTGPEVSVFSPFSSASSSLSGPNRLQKDLTEEPSRRRSKVALVLSRLKLPQIRPLGLLKTVPRKLSVLVPRSKPGLRLGKPLILIFVCLFLLLGGGFFVFYRLARAQVRVFVQPQLLEKEFEFTVSAKTETVDKEEMIVPVRNLEVEVAGEKRAEVKGKKTVGEKATGEVMIYNRTDEAKTLAKESLIKGPGGLSFYLAEEVSVASKTADLSQGIDRWGEAKASAVAAEIGPQYNLAADSQFTLSSISSSSILIKNPAAFSGGTSREIQAVTKEDRVSLRQALLGELKDKAAGEISSKVSGQDYLLEGSIELLDEVNQFNHEVGDEAAQLSLETKATYRAQVIREEDFKKLVEEAIAEAIPEGYQLSPEGKETSFSLKDEKKNLYLARLKQEFTPVIEVEFLPGQLKAKTPGRGRELIESSGKVAGVEISLEPSFFSFLKILPLREENIKVSVEKL